MIHVESFEMTYPPFSSVLKVVVELFLLKSVRFAKYRRCGVFVFHGHFDLIAVFFNIFGDDLPPPFSNVLNPMM
jgi:hypothetical protein